MIFAPKPLGNMRLNPAALEDDKKHCRKIGPCGVGKKALYLNSFFIDRHYYVTWSDVRRCFKRVAMSKGGYSGKGIFGSMPYLVVQFSNGLEKQCNFKYEDQVDQILEVIAEEHPDIPTHSKQAERRLEQARLEEETRYVKNLSPEAGAALEALRDAEAFLEERPEIGNGLSRAAKQKRSVDGIRKGNLALAILIFVIGVLALALGISNLIGGNRTWAVYAILIGLACLFFTAAAGILPSARRNKRTVQRDWDNAVKNAAAYVEDYKQDFPVPAQYAHPIVIERMIRIIREGKTDQAAEAFTIMKQELRELDHTRTVSQKEYDEIVTIKPMFRVMDYQ